MKEFIDKLIEKIVNTPTKCLDTYSISSPDIITGVKNGIEYGCASRQHEIIDIVNELAEEYKDDKVYQLAMMYAKNIYVYGVDVTKEWVSAVQNHMALEKAYMRGRQDERDRFAELQDKGGWIPCSERLPEDKGEVLVTYTNVNDDVRVEVTIYEPKRKSFWVSPNVIAWQPLPAPYTEGE